MSAALHQNIQCEPETSVRAEVSTTPAQLTNCFIIGKYYAGAVDELFYYPAEAGPELGEAAFFSRAHEGDAEVYDVESGEAPEAEVEELVAFRIAGEKEGVESGHGRGGEGGEGDDAPAAQVGGPSRDHQG